MDVVLWETRETTIGIAKRTKRIAEDTLEIEDIAIRRARSHAIKSAIGEGIEARHASKACI